MSVSVRTFLAGSVLEVSVFLLIEMDEIGLVAPEVPEDPAPGSEPKEPKDKQYNKFYMIRKQDHLLDPKPICSFTSAIFLLFSSFISTVSAIFS